MTEFRGPRAPPTTTFAHFDAAVRPLEWQALYIDKPSRSGRQSSVAHSPASAEDGESAVQVAGQ
jgi:hypothetical protein